jgi:hypothetical protein
MSKANLNDSKGEWPSLHITVPQAKSSLQASNPTFIRSLGLHTRVAGGWLRLTLHNLLLGLSPFALHENVLLRAVQADALPELFHLLHRLEPLTN